MRNQESKIEKIKEMDKEKKGRYKMERKKKGISREKTRKGEIKKER